MNPRATQGETQAAGEGWRDAELEQHLLSIEWNSIRLLSGPAHGLVTKTVHTILPEGVGDRGSWGGGVWVQGVVGVSRWWMVVGLVSRCHSIDLLPKLRLLH